MMKGSLHVGGPYNLQVTHPQFGHKQSLYVDRPPSRKPNGNRGSAVALGRLTYAHRKR